MIKQISNSDKKLYILLENNELWCYMRYGDVNKFEWRKVELPEFMMEHLEKFKPIG